MEHPYTATELDDILSACIEFKENFPDQLFYDSYIAGRGGVPVNKGRDLYQKLRYISGLDLYLLEYLSYGLDNIEYFDLGPNAKIFLKDGGFKRYFSEIESNNSIREKMKTNIKKLDPIHCDYVIITALEDDEMEKVLPFCVRTGHIDNDKHLIEYGHLATNPDKKIAWASQLTTGMVDASILATEMIIRFNPKFLIMPGVLGGKPKDTKIGDIVVSTKVFTIDKGKLTDKEFKREIESSNTNSSYVTAFKRDRNKILEFIKNNDPTRKTDIAIHFEPIACVRQVIDQKGFFIENISTTERKAIGLEME
ncbi:MAG: phosphorylase family protein [Flavobacteriales bacterium]